MNKINHIVFDIGKVLIHYDPHIPYSRLIPDDAERAWFFENVCTQDRKSTRLNSSHMSISYTVFHF